MTDATPDACTIVGIGNVLLGDEGVGVSVVRHLEGLELPPGVTCLDGGTGGLHLLEPLQEAARVILVDATIDGAPIGTVCRLRPRYSTDYPRSLTAHDIGLKDLLDALYLLGRVPDVTLFTISIEPLPSGLRTELSPTLAPMVPEIAARVTREFQAEPRRAGEEP